MKIAKNITGALKIESVVLVVCWLVNKMCNIALDAQTDGF